MEETQNKIGEEAPGKFKYIAIGVFLVVNLVICSFLVFFESASKASYEKSAREQSINLLEGIDIALSNMVANILTSQKLVVALFEDNLSNEELGASKAVDMVKLHGQQRFHAEAEALARFPIIVFDKQGNLVVSSIKNEAVKRINVSDRDYFRKLSKKDSPDHLFSEVFKDSVSGEIGVMSVFKIKDRDGEFAGVVASQISSVSLRNIFDHMQIKSDDAFLIRDSRDLSLLARLPHLDDNIPAAKTGAKKMPLAIKMKVDSGARSGTAIASDTAEGSTRTISFKMNDLAPFMVIVGVGHASYFENWNQQVFIASLAYLLFLGASTIVLWMAMRHQAMIDNARQESAKTRLALLREIEERTLEQEAAILDAQRSHEGLIENEKLASLGAMAAGVAHELNTPLGNSLLSSTSIVEDVEKMTEGLLMGVMKKSDLKSRLEKIKALAEMQTTSIGRAADLVKAFKQVAVDQSSGRKREFDVKSTLEAVASSFSLALSSSTVKVRVVIKGEGGLVSHSYPGALTQITANMFQNALRHAFEGREGGLLEIDFTSIKTSEGRGVEIHFKDDGIGMDETRHERVFETFNTSKASSGGSGVGLALSRNLAEKVLGGTLEIHSKANESCVFVLRFPLMRIET